MAGAKIRPERDVFSRVVLEHERKRQRGVEFFLDADVRELLGHGFDPVLRHGRNRKERDHEGGGSHGAVAGVTAADLGEGALPATLLEAIFLGDHVRLRLAVGDGGEVLAKRPAGAGALPEPGGPAAIAWGEGAAFAFRAQA